MSGKFQIPSPNAAINDLKRRIRLVEQRIQTIQPGVNNFEVIGSTDIKATVQSAPWTPWGPCVLIELFVELAGDSSFDFECDLYNGGNQIAAVTVPAGATSGTARFNINLGTTDKLHFRAANNLDSNPSIFTIHARFKGSPQMSGGLCFTSAGGG